MHRQIYSVEQLNSHKKDCGRLLGRLKVHDLQAKHC